MSSKAPRQSRVPWCRGALIIWALSFTPWAVLAFCPPAYSQSISYGEAAAMFQHQREEEEQSRAYQREQDEEQERAAKQEREEEDRAAQQEQEEQRDFDRAMHDEDDDQE